MSAAAEVGWDRVAKALPHSVISAVNLSEVVAKLADAGGTSLQIGAALGALQLNVAPFDADHAHRAGLLRPATRGFGLSFGDRACLALGLSQAATILTCDREWAKIQIGQIVELLR